MQPEGSSRPFGYHFSSPHRCGQAFLENYTVTDKPEEKPLVEVIPSRNGDVSALASAQAPFIFCDNAPVFGYYNGIVHVTLEAVRRMPGADGQSVFVDRAITAHLRMNLEAARALRSALDGAILMATPARGAGPLARIAIMSKAARNEVRKLRATYFNNIGIGLGLVGIAGPYFWARLQHGRSP